MCLAFKYVESARQENVAPRENPAGIRVSSRKQNTGAFIPPLNRIEEAHRPFQYPVV